MFSFLKPKNKRTYLDNAGATDISARAKRALVDALEIYGNPSAIHKEGSQASALLQEARTMCAKILNAHSYEVYFTSSGTESCNLAIIGTYLGAIKNWKLKIENSRPHIIVSSIEHPAVLEPIKHLEREGKIRVTYLPVYENGIIKINDLREALTEDTILVSIMYANNEIGTLQPVKEVGRAIEEWKKDNKRTHTDYPYFHTDACQAANYCNLDAVRLRAHLMTVNSSKCYGPKGIALLYKREGIKISEINYGGGQERGLRSGTESVSLARSFAEALTESSEMKEKESVRLIELRDFFFDKISKELPDTTIYGDRKERLPNNINIRIPGIASDEMILRLDAQGFAVSHKSACASQETDGSYVLQAVGATVEESLENVRVSLGRSTTKEDMENLVTVIKEIKEIFAR
jgi:cysteine desulfurase